MKQMIWLQKLDQSKVKFAHFSHWVISKVKNLCSRQQISVYLGDPRPKLETGTS